MNLYFNTKLTNAPLIETQLENYFFYPVTYPKLATSLDCNQLEVLIITIKSYSKLFFNIAIFNLDIKEYNLTEEERIRQIIKSSINCQSLFITFDRPSTINEWEKDIEKYVGITSSNDPFIVVMNHDHLFVDYNTNVINNITNSIFEKNLDNFKKVLYYSHTPEINSLILNTFKRKDIIANKSSIYSRLQNQNWVVSLWVMTLSTLKYIFSQSEFDKNSYIGRIDFPNVYYKTMNFKVFYYPREFFKHFDGYGHMTGIRLISDLRNNYDLQYPVSSNLTEIVEFYYQKWLDTYILAIKDKIYNKGVDNFSNYNYREILEESFYLFKNTYLNEDLKYNLLDIKTYNSVCHNLISHIYYNANYIFEQVTLDIKLSKKINLFNKIKFRIKSFLNY